jgi:hypothetical protein
MPTYKVIVQIEYEAEIRGENHDAIIREHTPKPVFDCVGGVGDKAYSIRHVKSEITSIKENKNDQDNQI